MKYKCIIFDCDGVLVDSEKISNSVLVEMAGEFGVTISHEFAIEHFTGKSLKSCFDFIEKLADRKLPDDFEINFREKSFKAFTENLQPIDGIHQLLERIDIPVCVASNGPTDKIVLNLTKTKLIRYFEGKIFSAYDVKSWKPNPQLYLHAAEKMGFKVSECVVIEDSLTGVQAAKTGGFDVIGFVNDNNQERFKDGNIPICFNMNELDKFIN